MDALKKAEQAKQLAQAQLPTASPRELALEPEAVRQADSPSHAEPVPQEGPPSLPELPKLEDLDDEFLAHARQAPAMPRGQATPVDRAVPPATPANRQVPGAPASPASSGPAAAPPSTGPAQPNGGLQGAPSADRQAIRNAFAIKRAPAKNHFALAIGALSLLAVGAIGIYFWLQLRPTPGLLVQGRPSAPVQVAVIPAPSSQEAAPQTTLPIPPAAPAVIAPIQVTSRITAGEVDPAATRETGRPARSVPATAVAATTPTTPITPPIRITSGQAKVSPSAIEGYEAFQAGNLGGAKAAYERLVLTEPWNRDALHGLAAIAQREGRTGDAEALYARILEADPRDAQAQAGLLGIRAQRGQGDPVAAESRIKSLLATQPDSAALQFALGNLYARQSRWSDAQQAYFQALSGDAGNPDYLFNLAVSLDQLHQAKLAGQYYTQALAAAENRPAAFNRQQAANRLSELQR